MARSRDVFGFWQGLLRVVGSFGDCPRCLAVCPVGNDYHAHLADVAEGHPGKDAREGRARQELSAEPRARRRAIAGPQRLEQPLGRAGRLQGHGGAPAAGVQEAQQQRASEPAARRTDARMVSSSSSRSPPTIKAKARELGADLVGIADGAALERHPPDPRDPQRPSDITDLDGGARDRARQAPQPRRRAHRRVERPPQVLQRRACAHAPRGNLARAGLLARGQRLSGDHRAADARRSVALRRRPARPAS